MPIKNKTTSTLLKINLQKSKDNTIFINLMDDKIKSEVSLNKQTDLKQPSTVTI